MPCAAMRGHAWPDGTTNITLRCQNNLAMPDKIWSCSARPFLVLSGCCQTVACCQGAVKNFCNDDACTTKNHRELGALGDCSERQDANNFVGRRSNWSRSALSCWRREDVDLRLPSAWWRTKGAITNIQARLMAKGERQKLHGRRRVLRPAPWRTVAIQLLSGAKRGEPRKLPYDSRLTTTSDHSSNVASSTSVRL